MTKNREEKNIVRMAQMVIVLILSGFIIAVDCFSFPNEEKTVEATIESSEPDILRDYNKYKDTIKSDSDRINDADIGFPGFTENKGQLEDDSICYYFRSDSFIMTFSISQIQIGIKSENSDNSTSYTVITQKFIGANPVAPIGMNRSTHVSNFFYGTRHYTDVPNFMEIRYMNLYEGIHLRYYSRGPYIKYDFIVEPYRDPDQISIGISGDVELDISSDGKTLSYSDPMRSGVLFEDAHLIAFQSDKEIGDIRFQHDSRLDRGYRFAIGGYDTSKELVIDPVMLEYGTFLGGSSTDEGIGIAVDAAGCVYVAGSTRSSDFPTLNAYDSTHNDIWDVIVVKLSATGNGFVYSTFIGGSIDERGYGIAVDAAGCAYVTGYTRSSDFPTLNAYDSSFNGGVDVFVVKLNAAGNGLVYSTFLGGSSDERGHGIAVDAAGCAYVTGSTYSSEFPTLNAYDSSYNGESDVFVVKLNAGGNGLVYSTFLGGSSDDYGIGIAVDAAGCAYISGETYSSDFPTLNAYDSSYNGDRDVFVVKLNVGGNGLVYSTFIGGPSDDYGYGIVLDAAGCAYITGSTYSSDFPTLNAYDSTHNGVWDVFVVKLNGWGNGLVYSTFLGGSSDDYGYGIVVDAAGCAYVTGITWSSDFPTLNAYDSTHNGEDDVFVVKLSTIDSDVDGMPDWWEYQMGLNATFNDANLDKEGDGMPNVWEYQMGLNATFNDANLDKDSDGLSNLEEYLKGANPNLWDSDYDGFNDRIDPWPTEPVLPILIIIIVVSIVVSLSIVSVKFRSRRKKQRAEEEKRHKAEVLKATPKTVEDLIKTIKELNGIAESEMAKGNDESALKFFYRQMELYPPLLSELEKIGMDTLIPSINEEKLQINRRIYDVLHRMWVSKYGSLTNQLKTVQDKGDFETAKSVYKQLIPLVSERVQRATEFKNEEDRVYYENLLSELKKREEINHFFADYKALEANVNKLIGMINSNRISEASLLLSQLTDRAMAIREKIVHENSDRQEIKMLGNAVTNILDRLTEIRQMLKGRLESQIKGMAITNREVLHEISTKMGMAELPDLKVQKSDIPLYAKVVLLGDSSVGKTHLVLSITGRKYEPIQGSTVGVDKYFLGVRMGMVGLSTTISFWDLGGQFNFRTINEVFIRDAELILLVFDITRKDTFDSLSYWVNLLHHTKISADKVFVVANKIDVGGSMIAAQDLHEFLEENKFSRIFKVSAKTGEGLKELVEALPGAIDWSLIIKGIGSDFIGQLIGVIATLKKEKSIWSTSEFISKVEHLIPMSNPILIKAGLRQCATQELVQFGKFETYIIIDPVPISKNIARIISIAANSEGIVSESDLVSEKMPANLITSLFLYLENEQICYNIGTNSWLLPGVIHKRDIDIDDDARQILNSGTLSSKESFIGPGMVVFTRCVVILKGQIGRAKDVSNREALWVLGTGRDRTALLIQYEPTPKGGVFFIRCGGGKNSEIFELSESIFQTLVKEYS